MPIEIIVPRLGWSMDEGTLAEWLKRDGEPVQVGEMIFVLEGDKAEQEIESFDAGLLHIPADAPQPGDNVVVGQLLGYLLAEGESLPVGPLPRKPTDETSEEGVPVPRQVTRDQGGRNSPLQVATPRARRKARQLGVSWQAAQGTGRNGRIRERDILALAGAERPAGSSLPGTQTSGSLIRRTIAQKMMAGVHQTAPVTLTTKIDANALVACRQQWRSEQQGAVIPSYNDLLVAHIAAILPDCPELNACWRDQGIYLYADVNIAIAVETDQGLLAPVLRNVTALTIDEIAARSQALIGQARTGQLAADQLQGGTFTVTNLGMFDIDFFTPILNVSQSAILGVGRIVEEPVVEKSQVVPGKTLGLSLTFDHRVIDGAPAARWLQQLGKRIAHGIRM